MKEPVQAIYSVWEKAGSYAWIFTVFWPVWATICWTGNNDRAKICLASQRDRPLFSSTDFMTFLFIKKHKKIGIYKMEKPNTKKRYFNYKRENSQPNTSYTWKKQINSVYPKKVNSGPAWTRTICNKLALSKSIMAKPGQNIFKFKPLSAGHKDGTVTSQRLFRKHNNAFTDIRPFTCNLRSSKKNFHLSPRAESRQKFLSLRRLTEWRSFTERFTARSDRTEGNYLTKFSMKYYISCTFTCKITLGFPRNCQKDRKYIDEYYIVTSLMCLSC